VCAAQREYKAPCTVVSDLEVVDQAGRTESSGGQNDQRANISGFRWLE
jgi:hypothetical protein